MIHFQKNIEKSNYSGEKLEEIGNFSFLLRVDGCIVNFLNGMADVWSIDRRKKCLMREL